TVSVGMVLANRCHRQNMKTSIINGSEVSRLSVAIHRGKQADQERHKKVLYYRQVKKLSIRETAEATSYSTSQVCRVQALFRPEN
ncbi:hypothetical protein ACOTX3_25515, partial [Enterobacter cloacae complex sp. IR5384]